MSLTLDVLRGIRTSAERKIVRLDRIIQRSPNNEQLTNARRWWARVAYRAQAHIERWEAEYASE